MQVCTGYPQGMSAPPPSLAKAAAITRRITLMSVAVALILVVVKAIAWRASGSLALLASLADSALDLLASLVTLFAVRYAAAPPDDGHRFGHGKAEAFASLVQAGLVFASAALIAREAIQGLLNPRTIEAGGWAMAVMIFSILLTAALVAAQSRALRSVPSVAIAGDRAHYAVDLASNLAALAGIAAAAWLGIVGFDAIAALIVAALLLWGAVGVFREASNQLLDHELDEVSRTRIADLVGEDPRITGVHQLRTRASGPYLHMQMHVDLDPALSLEAAHEVILGAERRVLSAFPSADIMIHADPRGRAGPHPGPFGDAT